MKSVPVGENGGKDGGEIDSVGCIISPVFLNRAHWEFGNIQENTQKISDGGVQMLIPIRINQLFGLFVFSVGETQSEKLSVQFESQGLYSI